MASPLKIINRSEGHVRIDCPCGKYVHDLKNGDDGPEYNYYMTQKPESPPAPVVKPAKERKGFFLFDKPPKAGEEAGE